MKTFKYVYLHLMIRIKHITLIIFVLSVIFAACGGEYREVVKSKDYDHKFDYALKYFKAQKYDRSLPLFEEIIAAGVFRGTDKAENLYYHYAFNQYYMREYYLAAYYFKSFAKTFPSSRYAEECLFMSAMCNVKNSPNWSLDQTETYDAINELQNFMNRFPNSQRLDTCNVVMDKLNSKLEKKAFEGAYLYYKIESYKAASVALNAMLEEFPNSSYEEQTLYLIVSANYLLAKNSVPDKKLDRFEETVKSYVNFVARFPDSWYRDEVEGIYATCLKEIDNLKLLQKKS